MYRVCTCLKYGIRVSEYRVSVLQKVAHEAYSVLSGYCTLFPKLVIFGVVKLSPVDLLSADYVSSSHTSSVLPEEYSVMNTFRRPT